MKAILVFAVLVLALTSCDRPSCTSENSVFDAHSPESQEYKAELVKEMQKVGSENLTYWLHSYSENDGAEYITVNVQGEGICAKGHIRVKDWTKIEGIQKAKGISYRGAQLAGLTFDVKNENNTIELVYKDIDRIRD